MKYTQILIVAFAGLLGFACSTAGVDRELLRAQATESYASNLERFDGSTCLLERYEALVEAGELVRLNDHIEATHHGRQELLLEELGSTFRSAEEDGRVATASAAGAMILQLTLSSDDWVDLLDYSDREVSPGDPLTERARVLVAKTSIAFMSPVFNLIDGEAPDSRASASPGIEGGLLAAAHIACPDDPAGMQELTQRVIDAGGEEYEFVLKDMSIREQKEGSVQRSRPVEDDAYQERYARWQQESRRLQPQIDALRRRIGNLVEDDSFVGGVDTHDETGVEIVRDDDSEDLLWVETTREVDNPKTQGEIDNPYIPEIVVLPGNRGAYDALQAELKVLTDQQYAEAGPRPHHSESYSEETLQGVVVRRVGLRQTDGDFAVSGDLELTTWLDPKITYNHYWLASDFGSNFEGLLDKWLPETLVYVKRPRYERSVGSSKGAWSEEDALLEAELSEFLLGQRSLPKAWGFIPTNGSPVDSGGDEMRLVVQSLPLGCDVNISELDIESTMVRDRWESTIRRSGEVFVVLSSGQRALGTHVNFQPGQTVRLRANFIAGTLDNLDEAPSANTSAEGPKLEWQVDALPHGMKRSEETGVYIWQAAMGVQIEMVYVPAGAFPMGGTGDSHGHPMRSGYFIGRYETTWWQMEQFRRLSGAQSVELPEWARLDHPVVNVSWQEAQEFCEWAGLSLPSEAQWEKAARGTDGRTYPWGEISPEWGAARCNSKNGPDSFSATGRVGSFPRFASPYGVQDMAGNVSEWCADFYDSDAYLRYAQGEFAPPPESDSHVVRGAGWKDHTRLMGSSRRDAGEIPWEDLGFRPVLNPQ